MVFGYGGTKKILPPHHISEKNYVIYKKEQMNIYIFLLLSLYFNNCVGQTSKMINPKIDLLEGKLVYSISGEGTSSDWELEILYNQDNAVINEKYSQGAGSKYIYDKKSNEILSLIDDVASIVSKKENYIIYYTQEELITQALSSNYGDTTVLETQEFKEILGFKCQKTIIKHGDQAVVEVWLTDKIKPGVLYPWTPLTFGKVALEYELKILGDTERKYQIKSISNEQIDESEFKHVVPDSYYLIIPVSIFSINDIWTKDYKENTFQSFSYPYFKDGRQSTIQFVKDELSKIVKFNDETNISIDFLVNKDGTISEIEVNINYNKDDKRIEKINHFIESMKLWTPAKVKGEPVISKVTILG